MSDLFGHDRFMQEISVLRGQVDQLKSSADTLRAQLTEARRVLKLVQFSGSAHSCPICSEFSADGRDHSYIWGNTEPKVLLPGHAPDCALAKALGEGG